MNGRADLRDAHLERANLGGAHLERAELGRAHLEGAYFLDAHLEGANLLGAEGLSDAWLAQAHGDAATQLPAGVARPAHWPAADTGPAPPSSVA